MTKERRGTTLEFKDRENILKKKKERQRKQKTGRIDEGTLRNDTGIQKQRKWTEERERTTAEIKDRENGLKKEKERHRKQMTV